MNAVELLREQFNSHVDVREKRPGVLQLIAPLFHEDGDMMDIFLDVPKNGTVAPVPKIRVSDHGLTIMRLSYTFEIDTPNKERIFHRILAENGITEENGELIRQFLNAQPTMRLERERALTPWQDGVDGAYVARLVKES